ncbi:hypothetical protein DLM46_34865 [Paraburkholderia lacunae]|uniref:Uncharacterized protein n=1 Tax=Paraburkholderia lacunae TaxID=2211104 RepID=A0A370MXQ3_9BURK|nr:hypothetical protein DLM46_34865 [Paraburkholderia lacunae]
MVARKLVLTEKANRFGLNAVDAFEKRFELIQQRLHFLAKRRVTERRLTTKQRHVARVWLVGRKFIVARPQGNEHLGDCWQLCQQFANLVLGLHGAKASIEFVR